MPLRLFPLIAQSPDMTHPATQPKTGWIVVLIALTLALLLGFAFWRLCQRAVHKATAGLSAIQECFSAEQLTTRFISAIPEITRELNLEVATLIGG